MVFRRGLNGAGSGQVNQSPRRQWAPHR